MTYVGEYRDRLRDGYGSYVFPSGSFRYDGDWQRGQMHGRGAFSLPDGGSYEGDFEAGEIDGVGLRRWPDGSTYNGQFQRGERHGEGVFIAATGEVYEGHWEHNQRQGCGKLRLTNGDVYHGAFHHHKPHGSGQLRCAANATTYDGDWVDGKINGRGILRDNQGRKLYEGEWFDGQRCGHGVGFVSASVTSSIVFTGGWTKDKPISPTTKLAIKIVVPPSAGENSEELKYQDAPGVITLDKKTGLCLPLLAGVSIRESSTENTPSIVRGESGRQLQLRVFEGPIPVPVLVSVQSARDEEDPKVKVSPPSQWQFALPVASESLPVDGDTEQAPNQEAVTTAEGEPKMPTPEEQRFPEVIVPNEAGVSIFEKLALPTASLVGTYHLVCDSIDSGDDLAPTYLTLQILE